MKYFQNATFDPRRISTNVAQVVLIYIPSLFLVNMKSQVPLQTNLRDCGCFLIYFARKFISRPKDVLEIIKVLSILIIISRTDILNKKTYSSNEELLEAWDLKSSDLTFVRRDLRLLLQKYVAKGEAVVIYNED